MYSDELSIGSYQRLLHIIQQIGMVGVCRQKQLVRSHREGDDKAGRGKRQESVTSFIHTRKPHMIVVVDHDDAARHP